MRKSTGDTRVIEAVSKHIEKHIGEVAFVLHEEDSPHIHVDVHVVGPSSQRPYYVLVTSGMSERAMPTPDEASPDGRFAELVICLPRGWSLSSQAFKKEENWWPIRLLKGLARYPHQQKTWLYGGHSMTWSDPPEPFASNTRMTSVVLLKPRLVPKAAHIVHFRKNKHGLLWGVYPLYQEELELKLRDGADRLERLLKHRGITELLDVRRASVVGMN